MKRMKEIIKKEEEKTWRHTLKAHSLLRVVSLYVQITEN